MLKLLVSVSLLSLSAAEAVGPGEKVSPVGPVPKAAPSSSSDNPSSDSTPPSIPASTLKDQTGTANPSLSTAAPQTVSSVTSSGLNISTPAISNTSTPANSAMSADPNTYDNKLRQLQDRIGPLVTALKPLEEKMKALRVKMAPLEAQLLSIQTPTKAYLHEKERLDKQLEFWVKREEILRNSKGRKARKARDLDYVSTMIRGLQKDRVRLQKTLRSLQERLKAPIMTQLAPLRREFAELTTQMAPLQSALTQPREELRALRWNESQPLLHGLFSQTCVEGLLSLVSRFTNRNTDEEKKSSLFYSQDIENLMEAFPHLKGHLVETLDWKGATLQGIKAPQEMTDDDLKRDGVTRSEYEYFYEGSANAFEAHVVKMKQKLQKKASVAGSPLDPHRLNRAARYQVWKSGFFQQSYDAYKKTVKKLKDAPANVAILGTVGYFPPALTVVPPQDLWTKFTNLKYLYLSQTVVSEVKPLSGLTNLQTLDLDNTAVSSVEPLRELEQLYWLDLSGTAVRDIELLRHLTNLQSLRLTGTAVSNVEALSQLTKLESLNLVGTKVSNVEALSQLTNLQRLYLSGTVVRDVEALSQLKNLAVLDLSGTAVSNIEDLRGCGNLTHLELSNTAVKDIKDLNCLKKLHWLFLKDTPNLWTPLPGESAEAAQARIAQNHAIVKAHQDRGGYVYGYSPPGS